MADDLTMTAMGRRLGVSRQAVARGIATGRIPSECVAYDAHGRPRIVDVDGAAAAWEASRSRPAPAGRSLAEAVVPAAAVMSYKAFAAFRVGAGHVAMVCGDMVCVMAGPTAAALAERLAVVAAEVDPRQ